VGTVLYLFISALAILAFAVWAATPGTHASPFYWWMTATVWRFWIIVVLCYLGGFLAGIRPGRWFGTRLMPVLAAYILAFLIAYVVDQLRWRFCGYLAFALVCVIFVNLIIYAARKRDFS
jgi:hypothetical protein